MKNLSHLRIELTDKGFDRLGKLSAQTHLSNGEVLDIALCVLEFANPFAVVKATEQMITERLEEKRGETK